MNRPQIKIAPAKLADDHGYRVASEAFTVVMGMPCSGELRLATEAILLKEAKRAGQ